MIKEIKHELQQIKSYAIIDNKKYISLENIEKELDYWIKQEER